MNQNQELITKFYTCFKNKDVKGMQDCYADNATFSDAVFKNLNSAQVRSMWAMLIKSGKDMIVEFNNVIATEQTASAEWVAYYTFSRTGNKVVNRIKAQFWIENGKIVKHIDDFDFYIWAKQSLGLTGVLLGWTPLIKNKIRATAKANLEKFMENA